MLIRCQSFWTFFMLCRNKVYCIIWYLGVDILLLTVLFLFGRGIMLCLMVRPWTGCRDFHPCRLLDRLPASMDRHLRTFTRPFHRPSMAVITWVSYVHWMYVNHLPKDYLLSYFTTAKISFTSKRLYVEQNWVINFNILFQSLTRDISYSMDNLAIDSLLGWKLIERSFLTTSLNHFLLEWLGEFVLWAWDWKG